MSEVIVGTETVGTLFISSGCYKW